MLQNVPNRYKKKIAVMVAWIVMAALLLNPLGLEIFQSISNQEFFAYHIKDIASHTLLKGDYGDIDYYISTGSYEKNLTGDLFGIGKGRNLIVIQMEAVQNFPINRFYNGQEITPVLNQLIAKDSLYFDNYYQALGAGNTSDAEFATNNSLLGSIESYTYKLFEDNYYYGLPWILRDMGYSTAAFHGFEKDFWNRYDAYPNQGFEKFVNGDMYVNDNEEMTPYISDTAFYAQSMPELLEMPQPFYGFFVTLSNHHPFNLTGQPDLLTLLPEDEDTIFGHYLNGTSYTDKAIGDLIEMLKEEGLYENTIIAIYGDHFGMNRQDNGVTERMTAFLGHPYTIDDMFNIPLIIHIPGSDVTETFSVTGSHLDFLPTIAYLMGMEELNTIYLGQNLVLATEGFVPAQTHMLRGSFINDEVALELSRDGVFRNSQAWRKDTKESVPIDSYFDDYEHSIFMSQLSRWYLQNDILKQVLVEQKTLEEILSNERQEVDYPRQILKAKNTMAGLNEAYARYASYWWQTFGDDSTYIWIDAALWLKPNRVSIQLLIPWLKAHEDVTFVIEGGEEIISILKYINEEEEDYRDRIIPVITDLKDATRMDYMGYQRTLLAPNFSQYERHDITDFLNYNNVWAIAMTEEEAAGNLYGLSRRDCHLYLYAEAESVLPVQYVRNDTGIIVTP